MTFDVVVVGAGAAGMMCASQAAGRGRRVLLLDHRAKVGERIRISGGGRCNVTNVDAGGDHYLSQNPRFCRSALAQFPSRNMLDLLDAHGIAWETRDHGQVFCARSAADVVTMLKTVCDEAGVQWAAPCQIDGVERTGDTSAPSSRFSLRTSAGTMTCGSLVVATGGLAAPQLGASPLGYQIARQVGIPVIEPSPALVPLRLSGGDFTPLRALSGVVFDCESKCPDIARGPRFNAPALITHQGLSGPAILQVSSYWQLARSQGQASPAVELDLAPGIDIDSRLAGMRQGRRSLATALGAFMPRRLADVWLQNRNWPSAMSEVSNRHIAAIATSLHAWRFTPDGSLGFEKAEVTLGGVDTRALDSRTMEARTVPGLYFIGEVVDVTGWLGGYNLQWAWSSGWVAGQRC
jgi:predicted Rossmann fold flavoprotein